MIVHRFDRHHLPAQAWRNGGGQTQELAIWPPNAAADDFDWRISIATVAQNGPFSCFPGVDRLITLLSGDGLHLQAPAQGWQHRLDQTLTPLAFAGETAIDCQLLGQSSLDFNVMTRRSRCTAHIDVLRNDTQGVNNSPFGLLYAAQGPWTVTLPGQSPHTLTPQQGLWWQSAADRLSDGATNNPSAHIVLTPSQTAPADAALIWVQITPISAAQLSN